MKYIIIMASSLVDYFFEMYSKTRDYRKVSIIGRCPFNTGSVLHKMQICDFAKCPLYTGCPLNRGGR